MQTKCNCTESHVMGLTDFSLCFFKNPQLYHTLSKGSVSRICRSTSAVRQNLQAFRGKSEAVKWLNANYYFQNELLNDRFKMTFVAPLVTVNLSFLSTKVTSLIYNTVPLQLRPLRDKKSIALANL